MNDLRQLLLEKWNREMQEAFDREFIENVRRSMGYYETPFSDRSNGNRWERYRGREQDQIKL